MVARGSNSNFEFHSDSPQTQVKFNFNSDSVQVTIISNSNSFQIHFTIISNSIQISNHIHFKFNSYSIVCQKTPSSESTSFQVYCAPKVRTCWLANALYFLKARLGSCFILAISRMFRFGIISDSSAGDEAQFLDVAMFQVFYFGCWHVSSCLTLLSTLFRTKHHRNRHALIFNLTNLYSTFSIFFHLTNEPCSQHCSDPAAEPSAFLGFGLQPPWPVDFVSFVAVLQLIACLSVAVLFSMSF